MGQLKVEKKVIYGFAANIIILGVSLCGLKPCFGNSVAMYGLVCYALAVISSISMIGYQFWWILDRRYGVPNWVKIGKFVSACMLTCALIMTVISRLGSNATWGVSIPASIWFLLIDTILLDTSMLLWDDIRIEDRYITVVSLIPTVLCQGVLLVFGEGYPVVAAFAYIVVAWGSAVILRKLSRHGKLLDGPGEDAPEKAYTEDGYIKDQDYFKGIRYRMIPASCNSCGCVAAFNLRHFAGDMPRFEDVVSEMNEMHHLNMPGPTVNRVMRRYLHKYLPGWHEITGKENAAQKAKESRMGIFRYREEGVPHFVSYIKDGETYRFFNVNVGKEDCHMRIDEFVEKHCVQGEVRLFFWEK